ncbi:MAG: hypothetical protein HYR63_23620 [Proteobacteria bacterium]|nr:hypothetical protein [Pseudomonadota bacterium]
MSDPLLAEGLAKHQADQLDAAALVYRRLLARRPDHAWAWHLIGAISLEQGRAGLPLETRRALTLSRREAAFHLAAGEAASRIGDQASARSAARRALALAPDAGEIHAQLASFGDRGRAHRLRAVAAAPEDGGAWNNLGNAEADQGRLMPAGRAFRRAVVLLPSHLEVLASRSRWLVQLDLWPATRLAARRALAAGPTHAGILVNHALVLKRELRLAEARGICRRALSYAPSLGPAASEMATALLAAGDARGAVAWSRRAVAEMPDRSEIASNLMFSLCYLPGVRAAGLHAEAVRRAPAPAATLAADRRRRSPGPLVVGYLSPDLARHPVGYFLLPVLRHHDPGRIRAICYSTSRRADELTASLRQWAAAWVEGSDLDDEALARRIAADGVDILVDLAGHTAGGRLGVMAHRPAPVQATWMGYPGTTGLSSIDYIIADAVEIPDGAEPYYSERPVRLPRSYICYAPPEYAPSPAASPADADAPLTFGCFNNLAKLNEAVFVAWARILKAVPGSRLSLLWPSLLDPVIAGETRARLGAAGVPPERVQLGGHRRHADLLEAYRTVDIALDPFPYSGGLTTLEALWMGVPVVTIAGDTFAGRHSASHLTAAGLKDWIAPSTESYVRLATQWAQKRSHIAAIRTGLRECLRASALCDGALFTPDLEAAYEAMWRGDA